MEEQHIDIVMQSIGGYAAIRIPETRLHWVLIANLFAHLNHLAPLHLAMIGARDIINGYIHRSLFHCKLIWYDAEAIDCIIHRYDLGFVACIDEHGSNDALASAHHQASGSIQIIHPAGHGLIGRR